MYEIDETSSLDIPFFNFVNYEKSEYDLFKEAWTIVDQELRSIYYSEINKSIFVVDKFVKSVRSKSEKCNSQFVGIVKFSKNGSIALNKILDNFHKQNNLDGEIIRIFEKLIDDSFPLHACFTNNQKWFNVNDLSQLESSRDFFGP